MLKIRTAADNKQLAPGEVQFESIQGAVSAAFHLVASVHPVVCITTVRGIPSRKAQFAFLDAEALDAFIAHLQTLRGKL
jgi:hypothetical protein